MIWRNLFISLFLIKKSGERDVMSNKDANFVKATNIEMIFT